MMVEAILDRNGTVRSLLLVSSTSGRAMAGRHPQSLRRPTGCLLQLATNCPSGEIAGVDVHIISARLAKDLRREFGCNIHTAFTGT